MERDLTVAEAARTFSEVIERAQRGESARVTENGRVVARIVPGPSSKSGAELARWWNDPARPRLTPQDAEAFEADLQSAREMLVPPKEDPWE